MKKFLFFLFTFLFIKFSQAQIICVQCFIQNDSISSGINNLVSNGSFENNDCDSISYPHSFCPNSSHYYCDIVNWTCTGGGTGTYANVFDTSRTIVPQGIKAVYFGNSFAHICDSIFADTSCIYDVGCTVSGFPAGYPYSNLAWGGNLGISLEQTINGLVTGNVYVLEFWAGGEANFGSRGVFAVDVGFGNVFLQCTDTPHLTGIGRRYIIQFIATSTSHTIKFTNWGHFGGLGTHNTELVLDDVRLYTLAEMSAMVPTCSVGLTELNDNEEITISPNPFTSQTTITFNEEQKNTTIKVTDVAGREIRNYELGIRNEKSVTIDMSGYAKGVYFVEVTSASSATGVVYRKMVKN